VKVSSNVLGRLIKITVFFAVLFATTTLFPFLVTQESYRHGEPVHGSFPVAVVADGKPSIVRWSEYERNKSLYKGMAFQPNREMEYVTGDMGKFVVKPEGNNVYSVDFLDDDYRFWSRYAVRDGEVQPVSFRFNGVFSVFYGLLFGAIAAFLIGRGLEYHGLKS
jgi:hypothetical protein